MQNNLTEIAFILDRSGSMQSMHDVAVEGFNKFLVDQQKDQEEVRLSLLLFDHEFTPAFESVPVSELTPMTMEDFEPRGCTALLDAIGQTIDDLGKRLNDMPEEKRPNHVIVAILTDGMENASERYSLKDIHKRISHQQEKYQWEFLFLSSDLKAIDLAKDVGVLKENRVAFEGSRKGFRRASQTSIDTLREMKERRRRRRNS